MSRRYNRNNNNNVTGIYYFLIKKGINDVTGGNGVMGNMRSLCIVLCHWRFYTTFRLDGSAVVQPISTPGEKNKEIDTYWFGPRRFAGE